MTEYPIILTFGKQGTLLLPVDITIEDIQLIIDAINKLLTK
ncbi:MAG: hypothetical protein U0T69_11215 [Chitinophagales bacterium]